jgi:hypothetical protein
MDGKEEPMSLINKEALIAEYDRVHVGTPGGARKLMVDAPEVKPEPKWIPCGERLPEEHIGFYLVTVQKRRITALNVVGYDNTVHDIDIARWDYDRRAPQRGYHWCKADKVIAWMPPPEPYRAERRTDGSD